MLRLDAVHVVKQDDPSVDMNQVAFPDGSYRLAEKINVTNKQIAAAITEVDREE